MFIDFLIDDITRYSSSDFDSFFTDIPPFRQEKVNSLKILEDKKRAILAFVILKKLLAKYHCTDLLDSITFDSFGKGHFKKECNLFFSISHSKDKVMATLSDTEVGCDIQYMKVLNFDVANRLAKEENLQIKSSKNSLDTFYKVWTVKESYLKAIGKGIAHGMESIIVDLSAMTLSDKNYAIYTTRDDVHEYKYSIVYKKS